MFPISRFNRYIVECKSPHDTGEGGNDKGFNRYIVECKFSDIVGADFCEKGFNRYIVECKSFQSCFPRYLENPDLIDT